MARCCPGAIEHDLSTTGRVLGPGEHDHFPDHVIELAVAVRRGQAPLAVTLSAHVTTVGRCEDLASLRLIGSDHSEGR
jgi:hypothetical protein